MFLKPIYQCDLVNEYLGFTDFGLVNGTAYNLGDNTGIKHYFKDENVDNGRTYYYAIVTYDYGAPDIGPGISPSENTTVIDIDEYDNIRGIGKNVAIVTPQPAAAGYIPPEILLDSLNNLLLGTGSIEIDIAVKEGVQQMNDYFITFDSDTVFNEFDRPAFFNNPGFKVFNSTTGQMVYNESPKYELTGQPNFSASNLVYNQEQDYWNMNNEILSDVFEGLQITISQKNLIPTLNTSETQWIGDLSGLMNLTITQRESKLIPWDCEIIFTSEMSYQSKAQQASGIRDEFDNRLWFPNRIILGESFNFYVVNKTILDDNGDYTFMDLVAQDYIDSSSVYDGEFNIANDRILVGQTDSLGNWEGTAFVIDFRNIDSEDYPPPGSRYSITWDRNFWGSDTFRFSVDSLKIVSEENFKNDLDKIRVVPNPYVGTNAMEEAVINPFLNQPRK